MAEFEEKLYALLSDKDAMGQIVSLAKSLNVSQDAGSASSDLSQEDISNTTESGSNLSDVLSGIAGNLDPSIMHLLGGVMKEFASNGQREDKNLALLSALRPFLKEKRSARIEQAVQIAKFSRIARVAFQTMRGGEDPV